MALSLASLVKNASFQPLRAVSRSKLVNRRRNRPYSSSASHSQVLEAVSTSYASRVGSQLSKWWTVAPVAAAGFWATSSDQKESQSKSSASSSSVTPDVVLGARRPVIPGLGAKLRRLMASINDAPAEVLRTDSKFALATCESFLASLCRLDQADVVEFVTFLYSVSSRLEDKFPALLASILQVDAFWVASASGDYEKAVQLVNQSLKLTALEPSGKDQHRLEASAYFGLAVYLSFAGRTDSISTNLKQSVDSTRQLLDGTTLTSEEETKWTEVILKHIRMSRYLKKQGQTESSQEFLSAAQQIHAACKSASLQLHPFELYQMMIDSE